MCQSINCPFDRFCNFKTAPKPNTKSKSFSFLKTEGTDKSSKLDDFGKIVSRYSLLKISIKSVHISLKRIQDFEFTITQVHL